MEILGGHYTLLKKIGKSSYGEVFLGKDNKLDRKVAIKVLKKNEERSIGRDEIKDFLKQTKAVAQHAHPGLVSIYDILEPTPAQKIAGVVMEYLEGKDLNGFCTSEILTPAFFLSILEDTGTCLNFLHSKNIIHGNIRPSNIFILADRTVKLLDFGGDALTSLTFAPPELMSSSFSDETSDVYSLGLSVIVAINNKDPFAANNKNDVSLKIQYNQPRIDPAMEKKLPGEMIELLYQMIEKNPRNRPQSMQEVVTRVQEIIRTNPPEKLNKSFSNQLLIGTINNDISNIMAQATIERERAIKTPRVEQVEGSPRRNVLMLTAANTLNVARDLLLQTRPRKLKATGRKRPRKVVSTNDFDLDRDTHEDKYLEENSNVIYLAIIIIGLAIGLAAFYLA